MKKIKVVHLINSLKAGGAERFLVDLIKYIPHSEFEIYILCLYSAGELAGEIAEIGIPVNVLGAPRKFGLTGYRKLYRALRGEDIDILHCHLLESCWYGLPIGYIARIPIKIAHLQNCHWHLRLKLRLFDRLAFQFADCAFGCSEAVLSFYRNEMWYPARKLYLVYNGVDPSRFENLPTKKQARRELGIPDEDTVFVTVASLTPQKGHKYLLYAIKEVAKRHQNVKFLFVGDGGLKEILVSQARTLGIDPWVWWLGKRLDVPRILAASDVFVLSSLWEGFGLVLVEAGLAELPVIASRVDGVVEIVKDGINGLLVPPKDYNALAYACLQFIENHELRERMGKQGRTIALERFSSKKAAQRVTELYRALLNRKRP